MYESAWNYFIHTYMFRPLMWAIFSVVGYEGEIHRNITEVFQPMHRYEILNIKVTQIIFPWRLPHEWPKHVGIIQCENCTLPGCYAASSGYFFTDVSGQPVGPIHSRPLLMGPIVYSETSVRNHHYTLRNNPEELIFHLLRGRSLKSRIQCV